MFDDLEESSGTGRMDFDNPKVYGDTSITDGLVILVFVSFFVLLFIKPAHD